MNNSRYGFRDTKKKLSSKPDFNITKGSMKVSKEKENDEEFRKTRDKLTFKEAKNIKKNNMNSNIKINNNKKENKIINDEDFVAGFYFGEVNDDEQLMQAVIEQSYKEQNLIYIIEDRSEICSAKALQFHCFDVFIEFFLASDFYIFLDYCVTLDDMYIDL